MLDGPNRISSTADIVGWCPSRLNDQQSLLIQGAPGTGKSILALQLMVDLAVEATCAIYLTTTESCENVARRLQSLWPHRTDIDLLMPPHGPTTLVECKAPSQFLVLAVRDQQPEDTVRVMDELANRVRCVPARRYRNTIFVIDDFMGLGVHEANQTRTIAHCLLRRAQAQGYGVVFIDEPEDEARSILRHLVDTIISMRLSTDTGMRHLQIIKSRYRPLDIRLVAFRITSSGITFAATDSPQQGELDGGGTAQDGGRKGVFLCHASEDKEAYVRPFAAALNAAGLTFWLDEAQIGWGDSITRKIGEGFRSSRFVVVFISGNFLGKNWPETELANALNEETSSGTTRVLPILLTDERLVFRRYPLLRDKLFMRWSDGPDRLVDALRTRLECEA